VNLGLVALMKTSSTAAFLIIMQITIKAFAIAALSALTASFVLADVIETKNGARLVGKITKIDGGVLTLSTAYAGDLSIKQAEIAGMTTDDAVAVRLSSGARVDGKLAMEEGNLKIVSSEGTLSAPVSKVEASWAAGSEDPKIVQMRRKWTFQTAADIAGKDGNTKSTSMGLSFVAGLVSPQDALKFFGSYQYATTTDAVGIETKSADETRVGVDYSSFFSPKFGWYVRSELERDDVEGIDLRSTSDFGATMRFIKTDVQSLVGRLGAGYRFESYPVGPDSRGAVLSAGLNHSITFNKYTSLVTDLSFIPATDDFGDYRFVHDSALEVPITAGFWKLRIGINNQYNSQPLAGREELDTMY